MARVAVLAEWKEALRTECACLVRLVTLCISQCVVDGNLKGEMTKWEFSGAIRKKDLERGFKSQPETVSQ
jgi:hypothetical protein